MKAATAIFLLIVLAAIGSCGLKTDPQPPKSDLLPLSSRVKSFQGTEPEKMQPGR